MAMVNKVLRFLLLRALIAPSSRKARTSRAAIISAMSGGLKVSSHAVRLNVKTSLTDSKLQVSKS